MKDFGRGVGVYVRIRPTANFAEGLIECLPDERTVNIYHRRDSRKARDHRKSRLSCRSFQLEGVLQDVSQEELYARVCRRVVLEALDGYNGTVMCFGQTGAGKTYTMTGSTESYSRRGIIPRALQEVFAEVEKRTDCSFSVHLSYLEIYNETLVDLLASLRDSPHPSPHSMVVMEEPGVGVFIRGLSLHPVRREEEALNLLFEGEMNRIIGSHALNRISSRSHCIFTVHIEAHPRSPSSTKYFTSKLNLVDLAGSERLGKTGSEGQLLKEAKYINKSLSFLEQAILALADHRRDHIPFRQTKLTHALKDSLGGNCNTVLLANIYGEAAQIEETLSTLRFASRMKCVRADPAVNVHINPAAQINKLEKEVKMLQKELFIFNTLVSRAGGEMVNNPSIMYQPFTESQQADIHSEVQRYLEGSLEEIRITSLKQVRAVFAQLKLAVQEQEQKVKAQLCQTYDLVEKNQSADTAAVKDSDTRGSTEDVEVSSGRSPEANRPNSTKAKTKRSKEKPGQGKRQGAGSPVSRKQLERASKSKLKPIQAPEPDQESPEADTESQDTQESQPPDNEPCSEYISPPPKEEAFEDFKVGQGRKINCILKENKAVLLERRSLLQQLTEEVNAVKRELDCTAAAIQQHKDPRGGQGQYLVMEGEPDATLLMQLRELKALYRQRYNVLRDIKAEVDYCQHLVDQCRVRLLSEFENWYEKSFLVPEEEVDTTKEKNVKQEEDPQSLEQPSFMLLPDGPCSESFYNARHRAQKRRTIRMLSFSPVQRSSSAESGQRRLHQIQPVI